MEFPFLHGLVFAVGLVVLGVVLYWLAYWARKGTKSVLLFASLFGFGMIPDPLYEQKLRTVAEAQDRKGDQGESGDPEDGEDR